MSFFNKALQMVVAYFKSVPTTQAEQLDAEKLARVNSHSYPVAKRRGAFKARTRMFPNK